MKLVCCLGDTLRVGTLTLLTGGVVGGENDDVVARVLESGTFHRLFAADESINCFISPFKPLTLDANVVPSEFLTATVVSWCAAFVVVCTCSAVIHYWFEAQLATEDGM